MSEFRETVLLRHRRWDQEHDIFMVTVGIGSVSVDFSVDIAFELNVFTDAADHRNDGRKSP